MTALLNPALAFAAGALTIFSPCVLPLVPIVLGSAGQRHKAGPFALCAGLVLSFTLFGFAIAALGNGLTLDPEHVRQTGAVLMIAAGLLLWSARAQAVLARLASPLANWAQKRQSGLDRFGLVGQALIGILLGMIWIPCVGPTLGAATVLAGQGKDLAQAAFVMVSYAAGISAVLLVIAVAARGLLKRWNPKILSGALLGKSILGGLLILVAILVLTGVDHVIEGFILSASPEWLIDLTTRI
jgi:cytochrome c-type biogenesis protein